MRVLIVICMVLVLSNVVIYLWPDATNDSPHTYSEKEEINANYVRLNKEIEDKFYTRPATLTDSVALDVVALDVTGEVLANKNSVCYRVGPFRHKVNYELAQAVLFNESVAFKAAKRESKESSVYRVFLGPYSDQAIAIDARTDLRRKKILDHFIRKNEKGDYIVSLGIYTTQKSALDAVALFNQELASVKYESELVLLPESYWLYFSLDAANSIGQQLLQLDWGERAAKMGKYECRI